MKRNFAKEMQKMNDFLHKKIEQNLELEVRKDELEDAYRALADNVEKPTFEQ